MKLPVRYLAPLAVFVLLAAVLAIGLRLDPNRLESPLIGKPAPAFSLASLGNPAWKVGSADFTGHPWVLNVWATWCPPCREEHPNLVAIARDSTVPILGLNWRDQRAPALQWLSQLGNPYAAVAFDPEGRTAIDWGVTGAPETFLIDANGIVIWKHVGPLTVEDWNGEFLTRLPRAAASP